MKATDLRIGNWVKNLKPRYDDNFIKIESIGDDDRVNVFFRPYRLSDLEPIPITEEILLKCGCYDKNYGIETNDNTQIDFVITKDGVYPFITQDGEFSGQLPPQVNMVRIQHLHQLQNLFFDLTGTELEINLNT